MTHNDDIYIGTTSDKIDSSTLSASILKLSDPASLIATRTTTMPGNSSLTVFEKDHMYLRPRHPYNAMSMTPDGKYMLIAMGNGANWGPDSTGLVYAKSMQTGTVYQLAHGLRNPTSAIVSDETLIITMMSSDLGQHTLLDPSDTGAYGPSDVILKADLSDFQYTIPAPHRTDIDDREGFLKWIGSSCSAETATCGDLLELSKRLLTGASDVPKYIICPNSCKSYIESL
jgi:hypothetical protein